MASERQIDVGGVLIGGGAPVAVQTMTKTETANLDATMEQIRRVAEAGADIVRCAVPREQDVEALKVIVKESPIPVIADIHFNHTLALKSLDAGAHCVRLNPGNIGGPDKVAEVDREGQAARHADPRRRELRLAAPPPARARVHRPGRGARHRRGGDGRAHGGPGLRQLQGVDEVHVGAEHDRREPPARPAHPVPAAPRRDRGGDEVVGLAEERGRPRHAAGRRRRRHDPHLPLDVPRRGGGQGRLGDPQGAQAPRAWPRAHRLPDLRSPAVRHGLRRRGGRAPPGGLRGPDRGLRSSAAP